MTLRVRLWLTGYLVNAAGQLEPAVRAFAATSPLFTFYPCPN